MTIRWQLDVPLLMGGRSPETGNSDALPAPKHQFVGSGNASLATSQIQVVARTTAKGILGSFTALRGGQKLFYRHLQTSPKRT
jgi:hypothetical protein